MSSPPDPDLIEAVYGLATGATAWTLLGQHLAAATRASAASLLTATPDGVPTLRFSANFPAQAGADYARHWHREDVWVGAALAGGAPPGPAEAPAIWLGQELVTERALRATAFYNDYCRPLEIRHIAGTLMPLGEAGTIGLALYRAPTAQEFDEGERRVLAGVLPHLRRAMQLAERLGVERGRDVAAALDAMPTGALILDAELRVLHANRAAEVLAEASGGAVALRRDRGVVRLAVAHAAEGRALAAVVRAVALAGSSGEALRLRDRAGMASLTALVMQLPPHAAPSPLLGGAVGGRALVLLRDPQRPLAPSLATLRGLFRLSPAEAAVAVAMANGATAEQVAASRGASVNTVRRQLRTVLEKTEAGSARDLARLLAGLPGS